MIEIIVDEEYNLVLTLSILRISELGSSTLQALDQSQSPFSVVSVAQTKRYKEYLGPFLYLFDEIVPPGRSARP